MLYPQAISQLQQTVEQEEVCSCMLKVHVFAGC